MTSNEKNLKLITQSLDSGPDLFEFLQTNQGRQWQDEVLWRAHRIQAAEHGQPYRAYCRRTEKRRLYADSAASTLESKNLWHRATPPTRNYI